MEVEGGHQVKVEPTADMLQIKKEIKIEPEEPHEEEYRNIRVVS